MAEVTDTLLTQKLENDWHRNNSVDNFAEEKELTVTITLAEYRKLVSLNAVADSKIKAAEEGKYTRETENTNLKKRVEELEGIIRMMLINKEEGETNESI